MSKKTPLIFVCSPYGGLYDNMKRAASICKAVDDVGGQPIAPHIHYPQFMSEDVEGRRMGLEFSKNILSKCDALFYQGFGSVAVSKGMRGEINFCINNNITVLSNLEALEAFIKEFNNAKD